MADKLLETLALAEEAIEEGLATFSIPTTAKIAEALAAIREQKAELESYGNNITSHNLSIKQEPVAWAHWKSPDYAEDPAFLVTVTEKPTGWQTQSANWFPLYAAPVRTKDLTDDEIREALIKFDRGSAKFDPLEDFRNVIATFKAKNNL